MGGALPGRYGLSIRMLKVTYTPPPAKTLERISEVAVVEAGATPTDPWPFLPVGDQIRANGLKVGMRFQPSAAPQVSFSAGQTVAAGALPLNTFIPLGADPTITGLLETVFGQGKGWVGYEIAGQDIEGIAPLTYPPADDRLFFKITTRFTPHHNLDFDILPVVAILGNFSTFESHYALGLSVLSQGAAAAGLDFDTKTAGTNPFGP